MCFQLICLQTEIMVIMTVVNPMSPFLLGIDGCRKNLQNYIDETFAVAFLSSQKEGYAQICSFFKSLNLLIY